MTHLPLRMKKKIITSKDMKQDSLNNNSIYAIAVGDYFQKELDACWIVYSPLNNVFFLATQNEVEKLEDSVALGDKNNDLIKKLLPASTGLTPAYSANISTETFCTLHILLNEKCNFSCSYCYSAKGRSSQELGMDSIKRTLQYFLSADRQAVNDRTVMFMGGGEPTLSWAKLVESTLYAEEIAKRGGIELHLSLTTNGSILNDEMITFLKEHSFTVQISFEVLPDIQKSQRGNYERVACNINRLCDAGVNNFIRSTITEKNVNRICEMVEHCHRAFPKVKKLSCQHVVDKEYFATEEIVDSFFDTYFKEFNKAVEKAEEYGIDLRSSSSHLINYSRRERFCFNLLCLTPYDTLTVCPDISNPIEEGYTDSLVGTVEGGVNFDEAAFRRITSGSIHTIEKCHNCYARWNCGSGCPSSRKVYSDTIFDAICNYYRRMLTYSLIQSLSKQYKQNTGRDMIEDIREKI